jgi:hypothetical protein
MKDYSKGKIYKIISSECDDVYYGSTVVTLKRRIQKHLSDYNQYLRGQRSYVTSFGIIDKSNYEIVLVEDYPCENEIELEMREAEYIKNNECVNKCVPGRTKEEYYQDNREKILDKQKQYYQENNEKILERNKNYYELNKDKKKQYREQNREKISRRSKEQICCEFCGSIVTKYMIRRHQRSQKCLSYQHQHDNIADCF